MSSEIEKPLNERGIFARFIAPHPDVQEIGAKRMAQLLALCSLMVGFILLLGLLARIFFPSLIGRGQINIIFLFIMMGIAYIFSRTRFYIIGSIIMTTSLAASGFWLIMVGEDPLRAFILTIPLAMILGSMLLPIWGMAILSSVIVLMTLFLGRLVPGIELSTITTSAGTFLIMGVAFLASISFRNSIDQQRLAETNKINTDLQDQKIVLEQRISERTISLGQRNFIVQAITDFTGLANNAQDENEILDLSVKFISERFNVDHVGIFLVDNLGEYAILAAANSQTGKSLIASHYQLKISKGEVPSMLPELDTLRFQLGAQYYRVTRAATLPDLKMNLSFAIAAGQQLIGLLNIQTISPNPENLGKESIQIISDEIALYLQNKRILSRHENQLAEINQLAGKTTKSSWEGILAGKALGYQYNRLQILSAGESLPEEVVREVLAGQSANYVTKDAHPRARIISPIILRGEVIGIIGYDDENPDHEWQLEEKILLETIASRVSLALENSRLIAETQQRAERERIVSQVATRMRETLDMDTVLQTAVREMRQSLGLEQAEVRLQLSSKVEGKKE